MGSRIFHTGSSIMHTRNESIRYESKQQCKTIKQLSARRKNSHLPNVTVHKPLNLHIQLDLDDKSFHFNLA